MVPIVKPWTQEFSETVDILTSANSQLCFSGEGPEFHSKPLLRVVAVDCVKADIVKHRLLCGGAEDEVVAEEDLFDQEGVGQRFLWGCDAGERKHGEGLNHEAVKKNEKKRGPHFAVHESYTLSVTLATTKMGAVVSIKFGFDAVDCPTQLTLYDLDLSVE